MDAYQMKIENERLAIERKKLTQEWWKGMGTIAAIIISAASVITSIVMTSRTTHQLTANEFAAKVAEVTFAGDDPDAGVGKAAALAYLLDTRVPDDIRAKLVDPDQLRTKLIAKARGTDAKEPNAPPPSTEAIKDLLRLEAAANPKDRRLVLKMWLTMFPGDSAWVNQLAEVLPKD